jgi:DNA ligase-1
MKFFKLVEYFEKLEAMTKRLKMFGILAELFAEATAEDIDKIIYLSQGQLLPPFHGLEMGMSEKYLIRAISDATNTPTKKVEDDFRQKGDLGFVVEKLAQRKGEELSVSEVYEDLTKIAWTSGKGSIEKKVGLLVSLLKGVSPTESKHIARFVIGKLRLGIAEQSVLDALAQVELSKQLNIALQTIPQQSLKKKERIELFRSTKPNPVLLQEVIRELKGISSKKLSKTDTEENKIATLYFKKLLEKRQSICDSLEQAYNTCSDLGLVAKTYKSEGVAGVNKIQVHVGYPLRMALCERLPSEEAIIEKIRKIDETTKEAVEAVGEVAIEGKYDGIRLQIHRDHNDVSIFSRNLERMNDMFPEITSEILRIPAKQLIIEGEALSYNENTGELLPFQETIKRRRKYDINVMSRSLPIKFFFFDVLFLDGKDLTRLPYIERRTVLEKLTKGLKIIEPAKMKRTNKPEEIRKFFEDSIEHGLEGIIAKRLDAPYTAGSRNFNWIKLKRSYKGGLADTMDVCIIGYFLGKGQRTKFGIGAVLGAVYDKEENLFKSITKIGTGFAEEDLKELLAKLKPIETGSKHLSVDSRMEADVWVIPKYIMTVTADEITRSPMHTAGKDDKGIGYALRFPRVETLVREDKSPEDATTVKEIIDLYKMQKLKG